MYSVHRKGGGGRYNALRERNIPTLPQGRIRSESTRSGETGPGRHQRRLLCFCLIACSYEQIENISLWEGVVVLEGQYIHTSRENKSFKTGYFWPMHTYEQRECHSYQYIHKTVQNQVSCHKPKNSFRQPDITLTL